MCGIAGSYNFDLDMKAFLQSQQSRGPDAAQQTTLITANGEKLILAHNRLKIICLSDEANQPFSDKEGAFFLSFNGEIYNYLELKKELEKEGVSFLTSSDTEVLLRALIRWGMDALQKLNGMFAFAFYHKKEQSLYLVRDRFGVKPLYYFHSQQKLLFASTSQFIAERLQLKPDFQYLKKGLQYGIYEDGSNASAYHDLKSVKAGHFLKCSLGRSLQVQEFQYYDLSQEIDVRREKNQALSENQLSRAVCESLNDACILRLNADVPVSLALSGGLDSTTVASIAQSHSKQIEAFCFGSVENQHSEGPLVNDFAQQKNIQTHFINPDKDDWEQAFWKTLTCQDAPYAGLSVVAQHLLYQSIAKTGFKVVLGGQGGDEAFMGYRKFQWFYFKELVERKKWRQAAGFLHFFTQMIWAERSRIKMFWTIRKRYSNSQGEASILRLPGEREQLDFGYSGHILKRQIDDVMKYSLPTLLRYEDRNSMAYSIESRLPFMDYRLIELGASLPVNMKLNQGYGKWIVRDLMKEHLPESIRLAKYKRGFDVSQSARIYEQLYPSIEDNLLMKKDFYSEFIGMGKAGEYFLPVNLIKFPQRFKELTTLLWLGMRYG